ncbi:aldehyde dehydrogenase family protein, partial [Pseudomonas aeruginosa]|uniref:aldehyde dehydrogenase family protein n=2 Tax=Pseudomonas TaxID=286 RepID=UPI00396F5DB8
SEVMQHSFGHDNGASSASGIINQRHVERLQRLLEDAQDKSDQVIRIGREMDAGARDMPFHIVVNPRDDAQVVREEIFGPILPVQTY